MLFCTILTYIHTYILKNIVAYIGQDVPCKMWHPQARCVCVCVRGTAGLTSRCVAAAPPIRKMVICTLVWLNLRVQSIYFVLILTVAD